MNTLIDPAIERSNGWNASIQRILVVDDQLELWWRHLAVMTTTGYDVDTAEDGEAAWKALQTNDYDLLITDNNMPKLWGTELIERVRDDGMTLPIIFASSLLPVIDQRQKHHIHNVHFLEKPVSVARLLAIIQKSKTEQEKFSVQPLQSGHHG